jgi:sec-independent protein translocase protein TatC
MTLIEELKVFALNILYCLYALTGFSLFFFSFGLRRVVFFGNAYFLPMPTENSFSVQAFNRMRHDLLPSGVQLVVTNPMSAFVSQILLSLFLGFMLTVPFFLYRILLYINPALFAHEKRMVVWSLLPSAFLFFSGSAFAYFFLVPATFRMLYPYAIVLGVVPVFR